jgi:2,5-diketo-D-gluconate reductase B
VTTTVWFTDARPADVRASVDDSRRRLGLDHLDLVLLHWPAPDVPLADTLGALAALREQGVIRELGVSNFPPGLLTEAVEIAPVFCNQVEFHPLLGQDRLLELCRRHDVLLTAYAPLANGAVGDEPVLADVATRHGRTPGQAALRWLLDHDQVAVIPKASSLDHQRENLDLDFRLSDEDRAAIDALPKDRRLYTPGFAPDWDA